LKVDEAQAAEVVHKDGGAPVGPLGKFAFHLRVESNFSGGHLIDGNALPRLGGDEDLVRGLGLFTAPRNLGHRAEEAASALGWCDCCQLLGDFPVEGELLQLGEGKMAEALVPTHELGLMVGSGKVDVFSLFCQS
jgi:hypothetical protein